MPEKIKTKVARPAAGGKKPATAKLIRLDDLTPKKDVRGGKKTFFGGK